MNRPPLTLVVVGEELRTVRGHVHVGRTLGLAGLARQTEVERLLDVIVLPAVLDDFALKQLEQHVRAAAGAVLFLERHHVAGTHGSRVVLPALAEPDTAQRRSLNRSAVVRKREMRARATWRVIRAEPQVLG